VPMDVVNHPRIELEAVVVQQFTDLVETTGPMPLRQVAATSLGARLRRDRTHHRSPLTIETLQGSGLVVSGPRAVRWAHTPAILQDTLSRVMAHDRTTRGSSSQAASTAIHPRLISTGRALPRQTRVS
jgi:hypothetical protein